MAGAYEAPGPGLLLLVTGFLGAVLRLQPVWAGELASVARCYKAGLGGGALRSQQWRRNNASLSVIGGCLAVSVAPLATMMTSLNL